jgi:amino acid transporter
MHRRPLDRIIGGPTALLIGMGVAIGSGIFRNPGDVAAALGHPGLILAAWLISGIIVLVQGMVTAELATRYPHAGGEYVFLREAYGPFLAFFFGWAYTVFVIGGGVAVIAAAFGDFGAEYLGYDAAVSPRASGVIAACAVTAVVLINATGLRAGAGFQNALTVAKALALLLIIGFGLFFGSEPIQSPDPPLPGTDASLLALFSVVITLTLWPYEGTTDAIKMAEEIKDVRRALPRAVIGSTITLIVLYVLINVALMRVVPLRDMAGDSFVPGAAMARIFGPTGRSVMLLMAMLACLGSMSSTMLATIRVTFALARDGLAIDLLSRMSRRQSPVPALIVVGVFATVLVLNRGFQAVLGIYFFASAILFALSYASLIVFRLRERAFPAGVFRCPAGITMAVFLILVQIAIGVGIAIADFRTGGRDTLLTAALLAVLAALYLLRRGSGGSSLPGR